MNNINAAQNYLGSQAFNDLCQAFVEQATYGHQGIYRSAVDAWNSQQHKAVPGIQGVKPGDVLYFSPNQGNGGFGHTGIYTGNNQFISATAGGVQYKNLNDWQQGTGQQLLGYIPQNQSAQGLGQTINQNTRQLKPGQLSMRPQPKQPDFQGEMNNFRQVWNQTHSAPLAPYI